MKLTPLDIRKQDFNRAWRGYDAEEVQAFLQMVSNQWNELLEDHRRLEERLRERDFKLSHYEKVEEALEEALKSGRETARQNIENAERRARLLLDEAEKRSQEIKREAETERHQIKREAAKISGRRGEIVARLRAFLMSEMELLARYEGDDPIGFIKFLPAEVQQQVQQQLGQGLINTDASDPHALNTPDADAHAEEADADTAFPFDEERSGGKSSYFDQSKRAALDAALSEIASSAIPRSSRRNISNRRTPVRPDTSSSNINVEGAEEWMASEEDEPPSPPSVSAHLEARSVADLMEPRAENDGRDARSGAPMDETELDEDGRASWVVRSFVAPNESDEPAADDAFGGERRLGSDEEINRIRRILDDLE